MRREDFERTYGRRGVLPPAPVHEYRRPRSRKKMKCLISLGLILPTLAAVIGVAAWAVSADVAVNGGSRVDIDGSSHLQSIPAIQERIDNGYNHNFADDRHPRANLPDGDNHVPPTAARPQSTEKKPSEQPPTVKAATPSTQQTAASKAVVSTPSTVTNVGDLLSQIISASRGASNGNPQFVVVAPLLSAKEKDELFGRDKSSESSDESSEDKSKDGGTRPRNNSSGGRRKNINVERVDQIASAASTPGNKDNKAHFSDRIGNSGEIHVPSASGPHEILLPLPSGGANFQPQISHLPPEEPVFIDLTSNKNVHHSFNGPSLSSFGIVQPVAIPAPPPHPPPHPPPPAPPKPPPPPAFHPPPYQNANRQFYPQSNSPVRHGPPFQPVRQQGGGNYGPKPPQPYFSDLVASGSNGNKNDGQPPGYDSNRWGTVGEHSSYGHVEPPPKGISFSISSPHSYHSDYHSHSEPLSVVKSIFLPFLPKPRVNLNGRVVFGVVLEKGIGLGNKGGSHHHHPPY